MATHVIQLEKMVFMTISVDGPDDPDEDEKETLENTALDKARRICAACSGWGADPDRPGIDDDNDWEISDDTWSGEK